jgi:hypothetical protein
MRKVLVVGLGGSGAKTLSLMMDELLAELKTNFDWQENRLPTCWKFVSVDVPQVAENLGPGMSLPIDKKIGGRYIPIAQDAATKYSSYEQAAFRKFELAHDPNEGRFGLQEYARWHPDHAFGDQLAVAGGAGAFRAIGRVLTLAASEDIYKQLKQNVVELMASDNEGVALSQRLGVQWKADQSPLVLLIGSMAGGSGASMLLDVADLLNALSAEVTGFRGDESAAFAYTPEVFNSIETVATSGGGIALASISELLSAKSMGAAEWSKSPVTWKALLPTNGIPDKSVTSGRGPYLTFPIGATTGGVPFGSKPEDVYRGFARVLAPLVSDDVQQDAFFKYVTTNYPNHLISAAADATGLSSPVKQSGAGVATYPVFFGGMGSAKLGTGRSRYREYAAQRIARRAVETLVNGFVVDENNTEGNPAALKAKAADDYTERFFQLVNLDGARSGATNFSIPALLQRILKERSGIDTLVATQLNNVNPALQGESSGDQGITNFMKKWTASEQSRLEVAQNLATQALYAWTKEVLPNIEKAYLAAVSSYGLEVAELLLNQLSKSLTQLQDSLPASAAFETEGKESLKNWLNSKRGAARVNWLQDRSRMVKNITDLVEGLVKNRTSDLLKDLLAELANQVIEKLKKSGKTLLVNLQSELGGIPVVVSTAAYREAPVAQWPTSDYVPSYFNPAVNEVLLTKTESFASTFKEHLSVETQIDIHKFDTALRQAASEVILRAKAPTGPGEMEFFTTWDHTLTNNQTHPHVVRARDWEPSRVSPEQPTLPEYVLQLSSADLQKYANNWVGVSKSAFDTYCKMPLTTWVKQASGNEEQLSQLLQEAIDFAKPLVTIDEGAARFFHGPSITQNLEFVFSKLPFAPNSTTVSQLIAGKSEQFQSAILNACDPAVDHTEVTIFSRFEGFFTPWAMESLTTPIRKAYETLKNRGNLKAFWKLQRARTLSQSLPVGQDVIDAMLRGFFVGRITGRVQVSGSTVSIFVQPDPTVAGGWVEFSKELLGGKILGLSNGGESTDKLNIPVVLLESLPLALVKVYGQSHESMTPYLELFRLGKNLKKNGYGVRTESKTELDEWFVGGSEFNPVTKSDAKSDELKAEAERILRVWIKDANEAWSKPPRTSQDYEWQIFAELAPNIVRACTELIEELNRTEPKLGEFSGGEERFVEAALDDSDSDEEAIY